MLCTTRVDIIPKLYDEHKNSLSMGTFLVVHYDQYWVYLVWKIKYLNFIICPAMVVQLDIGQNKRLLAFLVLILVSDLAMVSKWKYSKITSLKVKVWKQLDCCQPGSKFLDILQHCQGLLRILFACLLMDKDRVQCLNFDSDQCNAFYSI